MRLSLEVVEEWQQARGLVSTSEHEGWLICMDVLREDDQIIVGLVTTFQSCGERGGDDRGGGEGRERSSSEVESQQARGFVPT